MQTVQSYSERASSHIERSGSITRTCNGIFLRLSTEEITVVHPLKLDKLEFVVEAQLTAPLLGQTCA
jgi:hypothetical protein